MMQIRVRMFLGYKINPFKANTRFKGKVALSMQMIFFIKLFNWWILCTYKDFMYAYILYNNYTCI